MPIHRIADLPVAGRELVLAAEPEADLYRVREVSRAVFESPSSVAADDTASLLLILRYDGVGGEYRLEMRLEGVRELVLPALRPRFWLNELEVEDIRERQLEGCSWQLVSHFTG